MRGAAGVLVACTLLRMLTPVAGAAETVDHSTNAEYWKCKNWPAALKRTSVTYNNKDEGSDDDSFVWFCPDRCKSMPYMDVKLTFDFWFRTTLSFGIYDGEWYSKREGPYTAWNGNRAYRTPFASELQSDAVPWPESQVSDVGTCRLKRNKENIAHQEQQCWPEMKHLDNAFDKPVYTDGIWESSKPLEACRTGATAVEMNAMACFRTETANIFVTPAYVFYAGSTPLSTSPINECRVARVEKSRTSSKIEQYWSNPPTYQKHSLDWKSLRNLHWSDTDIMTFNSNSGQTNGYMDEYKKPTEGNMQSKAENQRRYEWQCRRDDRVRDQHEFNWNYYEARLYETQCRALPCGHFRTQSCWQNAYSFAASPCVWRNRFGDGYVRFEDVTNSEFATSMHAYGVGKYILQFDRRTMEASKEGHPALPESETTLAISIGERFRIVLKPDFSCDRCVYTDQVKGVVPADKNKLLDQVSTVAGCIACKLYEFVANFQCVACDLHKVRAADRRLCTVCPASAPMRRAGDVQDEKCTECAVLEYFNGANANGCLRLGSVTDGLRGLVVGGIDQVFSDSEVKEVRPKAYRALAPRVDWWLAVSEVPCAFTADAVSRAVQLSYRRWCGHREIVRDQQALLQIEGRSGYYLLKAENTTAGHAAIGGVCGTTLRAAARGTFDLQCTDNRSNTLDISVVRKGDPARCTVCAGAFFTEDCLPTYHPEMVSEEAAYFASGARLSSAGTCRQCYGRCLLENHYMSPGNLTCMWNASAQARVTGVASALPTTGLFYWYKQAPCKPCVDAVLNTTHAMLVKQCGNKRTYRTWDADYTTLVSSSTRSIPYIKTCCSKWAAGKRECTVPDGGSVADTVVDIFVPANCKAALELEDFAPVQATYCPPGWYVDKACAERTPNAWQADCCKRCEACGPGRFKTEIYGLCSGATFIDTEKNGCETSCLSNSYRKDGRCYRCEQCSTTGTGEHG